MNDIKATLVEKERLAWLDGQIRQAELYANILDHIIALEDQINAKDKELEDVQGRLHDLKEAINGINT